MGAAIPPPLLDRPASPWSPDDDDAYRRWRERKLAQAATSADELVVELRNPYAITRAERAALAERIARTNMALYRSPRLEADAALPRAVGAQLGLVRLDANWLAGEDGVSRIAVSDRSDGRGGYIPYTDRPIRWHTDGYYHPAGRTLRGMILHCVRPAAAGGDNALLDHELAYLALRDESPAHVRALMQPGAMTIPAREDDDGVARAAQAGPVFSVGRDGSLHMRYTARTRSIAWADDADTRAAVQALERLLSGPTPWILRTRLEPGMGLVCHNVLHDRSAFTDDLAHPRLVFRARYLDRIRTDGSPRWPSG